MPMTFQEKQELAQAHGYDNIGQWQSQEGTDYVNQIIRDENALRKLELEQTA